MNILISMARYLKVLIDTNDDDVLEEDYTVPYEAPLHQIRGSHTLSVTAYDGAGNTATSAEVDFIKIFRQ